MTKKKIMSSTIAILLVSSMAITLLALPTANAQTSIKSYPFIDVVPNPAGINQRVLINYGALNFLQAENDGWNVTISITKPDGTTETLTPPKTWSTGTAGVTYVPDQLGTYFLQTIFPQQWYNYTTQGRLTSTLYQAGQSDKLAFVVQQDSPPSYPWQPIPKEYWTRPADSQLRDWYTIMGSWLINKPLNLYSPYNQGPETPHILWSTPVGDMMGGLVGGGLDNGGLVAGGTGYHGYEIGDAYEGKFAGSVIISGVLYYNKFISGNPQQEVVAIDLHTGKTLWSKNLLGLNLRINQGQTIFWDSRNNRASFSYLICSSGSTWYYFDALTGNLQFNMTNVPGGTNYFGPAGEILKYTVQNVGNATFPIYRLVQWNSSYVVQVNKTGMQESWGSQVLGVAYNATVRGYDRNVSVTGLAAGTALPGSATMAFVGDKLIGQRVTQTEVDLWAISIKDSNMGTLLYNTVWQAPAEWVQGNITIGGIGQSGWVAWSPESQVGVYFTKENRVHYGFNLNNGQYLYATETQKFQDAWSDTVTLTFGPDRVIVYGQLISATVGGTVYSYNATTGKLLWTYNATDPFHESYLGNDWWTVPVAVTDGKIYIGSMEHSPVDPKPRGAPFICLNATTGEELWRADGLFRQTRWGGRGVLGDSIIATMDTYDQQVYAIGKGPSSTSVVAPGLSSTVNTPVVITGTVTDVSPGTTSDSLKLRFPNGVPAVSDGSMSQWMLYVYKQFERPTNTTGVQVDLTAVDSNMNVINVGTATTDSLGNYGFSWKPTAAGTYQIVATFKGSGGYYGSAATTYLSVSPTPETPTQPQQAIPDYTMTITYAAIAIIVAVVIAIAIVGVLTLRKRA